MPARHDGETWRSRQCELAAATVDASADDDVARHVSNHCCSYNGFKFSIICKKCVCKFFSVTLAKICVRQLVFGLSCLSSEYNTFEPIHDSSKAALSIPPGVTSCQSYDVLADRNADVDKTFVKGRQSGASPTVAARWHAADWESMADCLVT